MYKIQHSIQKVRQDAFKRQNLLHLKEKLKSIDISTNTFVKISLHLVPLDNKIYYSTLGIRTTLHPDIKDAIKLIIFQQGTSAHYHIFS